MYGSFIYGSYYEIEKEIQTVTEYVNVGGIGGGGPILPKLPIIKFKKLNLKNDKIKVVLKDINN